VGFPLVLKADFGYGASGVRICESLDEAERAFHELTKDSFVRKIKSFLRHIFLVTPPDERIISVQEYIEGRVGMCPFTSFEGQVLAMNPMIKKETYPGKTGPSSVVSHYDNTQICEISEKLVAELGYSGFGSFDFIIDSKGGLFVIEMNPRPVPVSHFTVHQAGVSLSEELFKAINTNTASPSHLRGAVVSRQNYTIALFPNEERRDPQSPYLGAGTYDIPMDDPKLTEALRKG
jgi:biotin carboxylase